MPAQAAQPAHENKYFGKYRGVVLNNDDPLGRGRLRVQVPQVLENSSVWAMPSLVSVLLSR